MRNNTTTDNANIKMKVFHPGEYIKDYIEDLAMTNEEFASRLGISAKQLSCILGAKANITFEIALNLSNLLGTSVELWNNLQLQYNLYNSQIKEDYKEEQKVLDMIDSAFLYNNIIERKDSIETKIQKARKAFMVANLVNLRKPDLYTAFKTASCIKLEEKHIIARNVWLSMVEKTARNKEHNNFDLGALKAKLKYLRSLTILTPTDFYTSLVKELNFVGITLVIFPPLKNSNINGVTKWINNKKTALIALNCRGSYNDKFWFSFFHEIKHVLQLNKRYINHNEDDCDKIESEADSFARDILIPMNIYNEFIKKGDFSRKAIVDFAELVDIHPGIVVGRLQKELYIPFSAMNFLKEKYSIST